MYVVEIAYESASHAGYNTFDIANIKGQFFSVSGPNSDGSYKIGKWLREFNQTTRDGKKKLSKSHGDLYPFDAFL